MTWELLYAWPRAHSLMPAALYQEGELYHRIIFFHTTISIEHGASLRYQDSVARWYLNAPTTEDHHEHQAEPEELYARCLLDPLVFIMEITL